jgi:hypothetical protein
MGMPTRSASFPLIATMLLWPPSSAHAEHPAISQAIAYAERADFASALAAFEEAESATALERSDLVMLYAHRATVQFALGQMAAMQADLRRLVALDASASLPASAPPPLAEALAALQEEAEPVTLEARAQLTSAGVEIRARAPERGADLVRGLHAWGMGTSGEWEFGDAGVLTIDARSATRVLWYAEAVGPGGVVIATHGTRDEPWTFVVPESSTFEHADDTLMHWFIGGGTAAIAVSAIVLGVVLGLEASTSTTTVGGPMFVP